MNISVKGEYALQALFDLASQPPGGPIKIGAIAKRQQIPQKFLELILAGLKQGGFVESRRGAEGGYMLARPADRISVGEVLRFVEGRTDEKTQRRNRGESPFTEIWKDIDRAVADVLDSKNFAAIVRDWTEKRAKFVPNWEI
jgi:Rrf2 family cysteine metabolism transcriptional repressor